VDLAQNKSGGLNRGLVANKFLFLR
jgi:hypothetical protein